MSERKSKGYLRAIFEKPGTLLRAVDECGCFEPGMETIQVEQVLGANSAQRVIELDMYVPAQKPDIEQIVDVYVKEVCIRDIDVIPDKVIVRGELEVKIMYVADLPNQPVHAFERKNIRWTRDIEVPGAVKDNAATADVAIEFVDYDHCFDDDPRKVHVTVVLKVWTRVTSTAEMDAYILSPVDVNGYSDTTASTVVSASETGSDNQTSASQTGGGDIYAVGPENLLVTAAIPTAGTSMGVSGTAMITGNNVNIRSGPGTNFPVVTKVNSGTTVTLKEEAFGWYRVALSDGTTGWVAGWLVYTS